MDKEEKRTIAKRFDLAHGSHPMAQVKESKGAVRRGRHRQQAVNLKGALGRKKKIFLSFFLRTAIQSQSSTLKKIFSFFREFKINQFFFYFSFIIKLVSNFRDGFTVRINSHQF